MTTFHTVFGARRILVGVIHVDALPGTPNAHLEPDAIAERALSEARTYERAGFHAVLERS
jgi:predicted TIM-barrel enzyme